MFGVCSAIFSVSMIRRTGPLTYVCRLFAFVYTGRGSGGGAGGEGVGLLSDPKGVCGVCTESDSGEMSGRARRLVRDGHPSTWSRDHAPSWLSTGRECSRSASLTVSF